MSGITGDFGELDAVIAQMAGLQKVTERAAQTAAPKIQALCRSLYASQKGPDGTPWKPNKDGSFPSLARPAANVTFTASGSSIVGEAEEVLAYHQRGNEKLPKRPVFPEPGTIPANWLPILDAALREELEKL